MYKSGRFSHRFFCLFCLLGLLVSSLSSNTANDPQSLLDEGIRLAENEQFPEALKLLNRAMGMLRQVPSSNPLRIEVEKQVRLTKGRFLVTRYRGGNLRNYPKLSN